MKKILNLIVVLAVLFSIMLFSSQAWTQDSLEQAIALAQTKERGPVKVTLNLTPKEPVIGDHLKLTLKVIAESQVELLMPEFGQSLSRFAIIDFVPRQDLDEQGRTVSSHTYTLSPQRSGDLSIPRLTIEFVDRRPGKREAPEGEDAYEILTDQLNFKVQSVAPETAANTLKPPLGELALITKKKAQNTTTLTLLILIPLFIIAIAGYFWWHKNSARNRRENAYERARRRLEQLKKKDLPSEDQVESFFVSLSDIVRHYLEDRFELHAPEFTTEEFLEVAAHSPDLTDAHRQFLRDFLQRADQVKFARFVPGANELTDALKAAEDFLEQTKPVENKDV